MESINLPIVENDKISTFFVKANHHLLTKHSEKFKATTNLDQKIQILKELWNQDFSCMVHFKNDMPESIEFSSRNIMIAFFLRFGN